MDHQEKKTPKVLHVREKRKMKKRDEEQETSVDNECDDEYVEAPEDICSACLGREGFNKGSNWIGCNRCPRWYHKSCLSENIAQMSLKKLQAFNFICNFCDTNEKKQKTHQLAGINGIINGKG